MEGAVVMQRNAQLIDRIAAHAEATDQIDGDLSRDVADLRSEGWLTACLPNSAGGQGWGCEADGTIEAFDALRALGRANLSVARLFEGHMNAIKLVVLYGSEEELEQVAAAIAGEALFGVWGANDRTSPVTCERRGRNGSSGLQLSGAKIFASGLGLVTHAVVTCSLNGKEQLLLVPSEEIERADMSAWTMSGMRATQSGRYDLTGLILFEGSMLGKAGDYAREPYFEGGIWRYCAAHLGGAEHLYEEMRDTLIERERARDPHQQRRIAEAAIAIETARLWLRRAATEIEADNASAQKATLALLAREVTYDACRSVIALSESALGLAAHQEGTPIERIRRDLSVFLCQAVGDAKRARAADALINTRMLVEDL